MHLCIDCRGEAFIRSTAEISLTLWGFLKLKNGISLACHLSYFVLGSRTRRLTGQ